MLILNSELSCSMVMLVIRTTFIRSRIFVHSCLRSFYKLNKVNDPESGLQVPAFGIVNEFFISQKYSGEAMATVSAFLSFSYICTMSSFWKHLLPSRVKHLLQPMQLFTLQSVTDIISTLLFSAASSAKLCARRAVLPFFSHTADKYCYVDHCYHF